MAGQSNADYWARRFKNMEDALKDRGYAYVENMERQFALAQAEVEKQIAAWYQRFAANNEIALADAKRLLDSGELAELRWTVGEYIAYGQQNAIDGAWMKQLENASARVHISRLEAIKLQIQQQAEVLYANQLDAVDAAARELYLGSYYRTAFEVQRGLGVGHTMQAVHEKAITKVLSRPWTADGQTFRDRCWTDKQALVNSVNTQLTQMIIRGEAPDRAIKAIAHQFRVSKSKAGRLVMTESAYFSSAAQQDCFRDLGMERYKVVAAFDGQVCETCGAMDGQVFRMPDYQVGLTAPPFHPWCRCCTAPYFEDMEGLGERWTRSPDGSTRKVPADMSFEEWKSIFIDENGSQEGQKKGVDSVADPVGYDIIKAAWEQLDFSPAGSIEEARSYATQTLNLDSADYSGFDIGVANMVNQEISRFYSVFGDLHEKGVLRAVMVYPKKSNFYAAYRPGYGVIYMKDVKAKNSLSKMLKDARAQYEVGFWSTGEAEHAIRHELGHAVQHLYTDNDAVMRNKISALRNKIVLECGVTNWSVRDSKETMLKARGYLSYYALRNDGEFIAESIAEYMGGSPGETARKVVDILLGRD